MEKGCVVVSCRNHINPPVGTIFFGLPKNPYLFRRWVEFAHRKEFLNLERFYDFRMCTDHFTASCFRSVHPTPSLKAGAIPTLNAPKPTRRAKAEVNAAIDKIIQENCSSDDVNDVQFDDMTNPENCLPKKVSARETALKNETVDAKIIRLEETVKRQSKSLKLLRSRLQREKQMSAKIIASATAAGKEIKVSCEKKRGYSDEAREALLEIYSMAPHLYPRYSKLLGLPAKATLRSWFPGTLASKKGRPSKEKVSQDLVISPLVQQDLQFSVQCSEIILQQ